MNKTIWKYELGISQEQQIYLPIGATMLSIQLQEGILCLWALVDPYVKDELVTIEMYGTGHPVNRDVIHKYISTIQLENGLVLHCFAKS